MSYHSYSAYTQGGVGDESGASLQEALVKIQVLDEENTRLRNKILQANEDVFLLQASLAASEVETKFYMGDQIARVRSELNFKSEELSALHRDHQSALKELATLKKNRQAMVAVVKEEPEAKEHISQVQLPQPAVSTVDKPISQTVPLPSPRFDAGSLPAARSQLSAFTAPMQQQLAVHTQCIFASFHRMSSHLSDRSSSSGIVSSRSAAASLLQRLTLQLGTVDSKGHTNITLRVGLTSVHLINELLDFITDNDGLDATSPLIAALTESLMLQASIVEILGSTGVEYVGQVSQQHFLENAPISNLHSKFEQVLGPTNVVKGPPTSNRTSSVPTTVKGSAAHANQLPPASASSMISRDSPLNMKPKVSFLLMPAVVGMDGGRDEILLSFGESESPEAVVSGESEAYLRGLGGVAQRCLTLVSKLMSVGCTPATCNLVDAWGSLVLQLVNGSLAVARWCVQHLSSTFLHLSVASTEPTDPLPLFELVLRDSLPMKSRMMLLSILPRLLRHRNDYILFAAVQRRCGNKEDPGVAMSFVSQLVATLRSTTMLELAEDLQKEQLLYKNQIAKFLLDLFELHGSEVVGLLLNVIPDQSTGRERAYSEDNTRSHKVRRLGAQSTPSKGLQVDLHEAARSNSVPQLTASGDKKRSRTVATPASSTGTAAASAATPASPAPFELFDVPALLEDVDKSIIHGLCNEWCRCFRALDHVVGNTSQSDDSMECLLSLFVLRLTSLLNHVAGRLTSDQWNLLMQDRIDQVHAFICRWYTGSLNLTLPRGIQLLECNVKYLESGGIAM